MSIFGLCKYNQSNRADVRIGDVTVKITTILTVRAMLTFKKNTVGRQEMNRGDKNKNRGAMPPMPPAGDAPVYFTFSKSQKLNFSPSTLWRFLRFHTNVFILLFFTAAVIVKKKKKRITTVELSRVGR